MDKEESVYYKIIFNLRINKKRAEIRSVFLLLALEAEQSIVYQTSDYY